jgi:tartrate-resistant acid phosphatase type 5
MLYKYTRIINMDPGCYFLGDIGCLNDNLEKLVTIIGSKFRLGEKVFLLGDNFYNHGVRTINDPLWELYQNIFEPIKYQNIYSVLGNHDYEGNPYAQLSSSYMMNNDFYYKYRFSLKTEFFVIDTVQLHENHCGIDEGDMIRIHNKRYKELQEKQLDWLKRSLSESSAHNKVVLGHYPLMSNGVYCNSLASLAHKLMPIFDRYNVTTYICGHEHNVQYIEENSQYYSFKQFVVGCSSQFRNDEFYVQQNRSMFDNTDNYYLKMNESGNRLIFDYVNKDGKMKYCYII